MTFTSAGHDNAAGDVSVCVLSPILRIFVSSSGVNNDLWCKCIECLVYPSRIGDMAFMHLKAFDSWHNLPLTRGEIVKHRDLVTFWQPMFNKVGA